MKIAVNKCYGGFGLSDKAHERLVELGIPYFESFKDIPKKDNQLYVVNSGNGGFGGFGKYYSNFSNYENRTNSLLIQVIEELGEEASGIVAEIRIVEVPDDIQWEIDEYDGIETVHEIHRSW